MKRKIIEIDEEKCDGCGRCIPNCPEGALQVIDGKARLVSDLFCDGLGACLGECPRGAIRTNEREAEPYDECRVMAKLIGQGDHTVCAHLAHLRAHGESLLYREAVEFLGERGITPPAEEGGGKSSGGCPGLLSRKISSGALPSGVYAHGQSALRQWPVQLKLLNPSSEYFENADLLVSADCVAHACGSFHRDLLAGRILIVFCPKLDAAHEEYVEKLAEILRLHQIRSITVARMEVPCCCGTTSIVREAIEKSGKNPELRLDIVGIDGKLSAENSN